MSTENSSTKHGFVLCVDNCGNEMELVVGKVYQTLPDPVAEQHGMIRIIDESQEDYLYAADWFVPIKLPSAAKKIFPKNPEPTPASPVADRPASRRTRGRIRTAP